MTIYLAFQTALDLYRYLRTKDDLEPPKLTPTRRRTLRNPVDTVAKLRALDDEAQVLLAHLPRPLHVLTANPNLARSGKELVTHIARGSFPEGSFIDLGHDVLASSPSLLFVQMGTTYSRGALIALGMELCGNYSPMIPEKTGRVTLVSDSEGAEATCLIPALTTASALGRFITRCEGVRGVVQARLAQPRVLDNSNSPQETATYLLLCLPRRYGGYGLPAPVLNPCLKVTTTDGWARRFPDLYWSAPSVDVEYQSDLAHTGNKEKFYADSRRTVQLTARSVSVLPLTRQQLYSPGLFDEFAHMTARTMGRVIRPGPTDWWLRRNRLRDAVLFDRPWRSEGRPQNLT